MVEKSDMAHQPNHFWDYVLGPVQHLGRQVADLFSPSAEAARTEEVYEISVELPGVKDEDIHVEVDDNRITVSGEKHTSREEKEKNYYFSERVYGSFQRSFRLPEDAATDGIDATHTDGVLTIRIPRKAATANRRKIEVNRG